MKRAIIAGAAVCILLVLGLGLKNTEVTRTSVSEDIALQPLLDAAHAK